MTVSFIVVNITLGNYELHSPLGITLLSCRILRRCDYSTKQPGNPAIQDGCVGILSTQSVALMVAIQDSQNQVFMYITNVVIFPPQ